MYANPVSPRCVLSGCLTWAIWMRWTGLIAISQQQATPDRLRSNFPTFVADTMLEWVAQETAGRGESVESLFHPHV